MINATKMFERERERERERESTITVLFAKESRIRYNKKAFSR